MTRVDVQLGDIGIQWDEPPHLYREFTARVRRAGAFTGELLGSTRMIRVDFDEVTGLEPVDIDQGSRDEPIDYLPTISDDRKARRIVGSAVKTALNGVQPQTIEDLPPLGLGMEN